MSNRNDAMLITGLSSAATRREQARKDAKAKETQSKGAQLKPHAEMILDWIAQEKAKVTNIEHLISLDPSNEKNLMAQIIAIQMHLDFLNQLDTKAKLLLRAEAKA